ncbi:MAG: DJ-1/PfpI family protein [Bacteroidota bacterium]|jgi:putative intracellular protease/amidase
MKTISVLIFDGFADWEPAFALTGLRRWGKREVVTVGYNEHVVKSMGGLRVIPDRLLRDLTVDDTELLLLPGGDQWLESYPTHEVDEVLTTFEARGVIIAGICAATTALARAGLFRGRQHTSNGKSFLIKYAPGYETPDSYVDTLAIRDRGVISANGLGAIEFAREIFAELGVFNEADLKIYEEMYRQGHDQSARQA